MNIPFSKPWITKGDESAVLRVLRSRWLTGGPETLLFERELRNYLGAKHVVSVSSCTAALQLALLGLGIGRGHEVIVPTFTFAATANAVLMCDAKPVLADVDPSTFNITAPEIEKSLTKRTKAVIVVHFGGQTCDMKEIQEVAQENSVTIIEDCAHALGSKYKGRLAGTLGTASCFSLYATKNITGGEGGFVATDSSRLAKKVALLKEHCMTKTAYEREHSASWKYDIVGVGFNYRMTDIQCALARSQLARINIITKRRVLAANYYDQLLRPLEGLVNTPHRTEYGSHVFHLYTILVPHRDEVFKFLSKKGVGTSVHFRPLHQMSFFKRHLRVNASKFPNAQAISKRNMSLPLFPEITREQQRRVVRELRLAVRSL